MTHRSQHTATRARHTATADRLLAEPGVAVGAGPAPDGQPAIEVSDLRKSYGRQHVLRGVDFIVRSGEVFCLLGPNGAGKTTMVEILEGFRAATSGTARVLGFDPAAKSQALRERIGVVLQECGFPRHIRVGELLAAWRRYYPRSLPQADLLEVVELSGEVRTLVRRLSGGQRRRLDFALALAGDPDVVFLDEPTAGFDPEARLRCWTAIGNLRSLGKTILLTTHYLDEAERLADRVAFLAEGRIAELGTPRELARQSGAPTTISFAAPVPLLRGDISLPRQLTPTPSEHFRQVALTSADPWTDLGVLAEWAARYGLGPLVDLAVVPPSLEDAYMRVFGEGTS
jgi:ABC-2 type transport system ATP-binding protein